MNKLVMSKQYSSILCWTEDGKGIHVLNTSLFEKQVLPKLIKKASYNEFLQYIKR